MAFSIRPAGLADARAIAEVHVASWRAAYRGIIEADFLAELSVAEREASWRERLSVAGDPFSLVAEDAAGAVLGFARGGPERGAEAPGRGEVYALYLAPEQRGRGAGRALFLALAEALRAAGMAETCVWALAANAPARRFYERLGGVLEAERILRIGMTDHPEVRYGYPPGTLARA